jgi:hypothetical protein
MPVADLVAAFLKRRGPKSYCDDCIAKELGKNRRQIQAITIAMGAAGYVRVVGPCSGCSKNQKFVTGAV